MVHLYETVCGIFNFRFWRSKKFQPPLLADDEKLKKKHWLKRLKAVLQKYRNDGPT